MIEEVKVVIPEAAAEKHVDAEAACPACAERMKKRGEEEYKSLMNRLKRIEGQVRGVQTMLENDTYCPDIMVQVSAINAALNSFNKELMANHIKSCVADDVRNGNDAKMEELIAVLQKLMK
jgi:DNA-binding FrmR family transcriptional regulator